MLKKTMKKLFSILVCAVMALGVMTVNVNADHGNDTHVDVRVKGGKLTYITKVNDTEVSNVSVGVTVSAVSGTITHKGTTSDLKFDYKKGSGKELEWRAKLGYDLDPAGDVIVLTFTVDPDQNNYGITRTTVTKTYSGKAELEKWIVNCPGSEKDPTKVSGNVGYDIDFLESDLKQEYSVDVNVEKVWTGDDKATSARPTSITVQLLADGIEYGTAELNTGNSWKYTFGNLPKYDLSKKEIEYAVKEISVAGYTTTYSDPVYSGYTIGYTITNNYTKTRTIPVEKVWTSTNTTTCNTYPVTVELVKNNVSTGETVVLNDGNEWKASFTVLDTNDSYTVKEVNVAKNYQDSYEYSENGVIITNTYTEPAPTTTSITVTKNWNDGDYAYVSRPDSIKIQLKANDKAYGNPVELKADENGNWTYTYENLDIKDATGKDIGYTVEEIDAPNGYNSNVEGYTITNTLKTVDIKGSKIWVDGNDADNKRPESIDVQLLIGKDVVATTTAKADGDNEWTYEFSGVPEYDKAGKKIEYTVNEVVPDGYKSDVKETTITNTRVTDITVTKNWEGDEGYARPTEITVQLLADGKAYGKAAVITADTWTYTFEDLPVYDENGSTIEYSVEEVEVPKVYESKVDGYTITNTLKTVTIKGSKIWVDAGNKDGKRPESITVQLLNGDDVVATTTAKADGDNEWTYEFSGVPEYDKAGKKIEYTVNEVVPEGYKSDVKETTITNTRVTDITVTKKWEGDEGYARPTEITVQLLANGNECGKAVVNVPDLTEESDTWTYTFEDLPVYDVDGNEIEYSVEEVEVPEVYESTVDGFTITNSWKTIDINVQKIWTDEEAVKPESITVNLIAGDKIVDTIKLTDEGQWAGSFLDQPVYDKEGKEIVYTVSEDKVTFDDGGYYTAKIDGSAAKGFVIENTYVAPPEPEPEPKPEPKPETRDITITKKWVGDTAEIRPESIQIQLYENGEAYGDAVTLTADNETETGIWTYTYEGLLVKDEDGEEIVYTVEEIDAPETYTSDVDGYTITNTLRPQTPETPDIEDPEPEEPEPEVEPKPERPRPETPKTNDADKNIPDTAVTGTRNPGTPLIVGGMAGLLAIFLFTRKKENA